MTQDGNRPDPAAGPADDEKRSYHVERGEAPPVPTGCPVHQTWSPLNEDYLHEPYAIAKQLQTDHPTFYAARLDYLVVTEMDEIERIFVDHETFASANVQDPVFPLGEAAHAVFAEREDGVLHVG